MAEKGFASERLGEEVRQIVIRINEPRIDEMVLRAVSEHRVARREPSGRFHELIARQSVQHDLRVRVQRGWAGGGAKVQVRHQHADRHDVLIRQGRHDEPLPTRAVGDNRLLSALPREGAASLRVEDNEAAPATTARRVAVACVDVGLDVADGLAGGATDVP